MATVPGVLQQLPAARLLLGTELGRFVAKINKAKNAKQEDMEAAEEVSRLRVKFAAAHVPTSKMRDYLVTAIYCEMLGRSARDFGPLHAISYSQHAQTFKEKRIGYLAAAIFLRKNDDISIMLVNTLIRDLTSKVDLEVVGALTLLHRLTISDTVPAVLPHVRKLLEHSSPLIRKKAVQAVHRFQISDTPQISEVHPILDRALTDPDFNVAAAGVTLLADLVKADPHCNLQYAGKIRDILERLVEGRAPRRLEYHGVFAPWIQVQCLEALGSMGSCSKSVARQVLPLVLRTFNHVVGGVDAAYAVVYEAIRTISKISAENCSPRHLDVELADRDPASMILQFFQLRNRNMRFLALSALPHIHRLEPWLVGKLQSTVVDHLADEDETLRRKAMDMVHLVAKNDTAALIVGRLLSMLQASEDIPTRRAAASEIRSLLRRFSVDDESYVRASLTLMEEGGDVVEASFVRELLEFMRDRQFGNGEELAEWVVQHLMEFAESKRKADRRRHAFVQFLALYFTEFLGFLADERRESVMKFLFDILDALPGDSPTARILAAALLRIATEVANGPEIAERTRKRRVDMQGFDPISADTFAFQAMVLKERVLPPEIFSSSSSSPPASSDKHPGYAQVPVGIRYAPYEPPAMAQAKLQDNEAREPERRLPHDGGSIQSSLSGAADFLGNHGIGEQTSQQNSQMHVHGLSVITDKLARPDCVVVTFSCTNISERDISDLALAGNVIPSYCKWRAVHPPSPQRCELSPSGAGICLNVGNLPPTNSVLLALEVTPSSPYRALVPILQAEATFRAADARTSSVVVDVPTLTGLDFLRPAGEFDVESFGESWETMPSEAQSRTSSKDCRHVGIKEISRKLAAAEDRCNNARGFFIVQAVELEIIAAARVLDSSDYCLLHAQLPSECAAGERWEVQVTVKAEEAEVAEKVATDVVRSLEL